MRSNRKRAGSKEHRFWADADLNERLNAICRHVPMNMPDLIETLVRTSLPVYEKQTTKREP